MGFSGIRAILLIGIFVVLLIAVTKFNLPGWILPLGLLLSAAALKNAEQSASNS
jgi:hypothetical protein